MHKPNFRALPALVLLIASASGLHAHTGTGGSFGFAGGLHHPIGGLDHLLAMVAVGLWAAQLGGRSNWAVPASFMGVMLVGGLLGMAGIALPFIEGGILISVLGLGVLIAASARLPLAASAALVGVFAIFHGYAHGAEMPAGASGLLYVAGFLLSTGFLHLAGIALGVGMRKLSAPVVVRFAGAAIFAAGIATLFV